MDTLNELSNDYLGPNYNYAQEIKGPHEIGMSSGGNFGALVNDVAGLIEYVEVLVSGSSKAQRNPGHGPLGNKYFLKTIAQCKDIDTQKLVPRSIYINNVPTGNIPFISGLSGVDFSEFRGLIPGVITNIEVLNPITIGEALLSGPNPDCANITLPTKLQQGTGDGLQDVAGEDSGYITLTDMYNMDPCDVGEKYCKPDWGYQSGTGNQCCTLGFQNINSDNKKKRKKDVFAEIYIIIISLLGLYIFLYLLHKITKTSLKTKKK